MAYAEETITIKVSPKACYQVITDYQKYPEFLTETTAVVIKNKSGTSATVKFTIDVIKKISYTLKLKGTPGKRLEWTMVEGDFMRKNEGRWELTEIKPGITEAKYGIDIEFGLLVPGLIEKKLISHHMPVMLKAFKNRIEGLKGKE